MSTVTVTKKREEEGKKGGMLQQRVHILFSYLCLVFVKTFYSAPAAKVSISAIVKFLHAQQIKMSARTHTHTPMDKLSHDTCNVNDQRQLLLPSLPPLSSGRLKQTQINNDVYKMKCPA